MKKYYSFLLLFLCNFTQMIVADPIICFFFKPITNGNRIAHKLKKPGKIAQHTINNLIEQIPVAGIYVTYSGYITVSDSNGEIQFPRKHRENMANIVITSELEPVGLSTDIINHWNILPHVPTQMYTLQEVYNSKTKEYAWQARETSLPDNNQIPLTSLIIIAKPKNVFIPLETTKTIKSANLMLPPIYVKKGINSMSQGLYTLTIRHLFRPVGQKVQQNPLRFTTHVLN